MVTFKEQKFGVLAHNALGIYNKDLKELARRIPKDDSLAIQLFNTDIYEARLLCSKLFKPGNLTEQLMEEWLVTFENWEICDAFSMSVFARSPLAVAKAIEWTAREREFEKRAGFATIAGMCSSDKKSENELFLQFFPFIEKESVDDRVYVKKAVNWALRSIGKRNVDLRNAAITVAQRIEAIDHKSARWIAKDALKELERDEVRIADYPRHIYRKEIKNK